MNTNPLQVDHSPAVTPKRGCMFTDVNVACTQWLRARGLILDQRQINHSMFKHRRKRDTGCQPVLSVPPH